MAKNFDREINRIQREEALLEESLDPPRPLAPLRYERDAAKALDRWVRKSGLDLKALEALRIERKREIDRSAKKLNRVISQQGAALRKANLAQARALRALASPAIGPLPADATVILDQAHSIRTLRDPNALTDSRISPGDNFARILVKRKGTSRDRLNFAFVWRNTNEDTTSIDVSATMSVAGFVGLHVGNTLLGNSGGMDVIAQMTVRRFPFSFGLKSEPRFIQSLFAINLPVWPAMDASGDAVATVDHNVRGFLLAGGATLMVVVTLIIKCDFEHGEALADFDSGSKGVSVPQVTLGITSLQNAFVTRR